MVNNNKNKDFIKKKNKVGKTNRTPDSHTNTQFTAKRVHVRLAQQLDQDHNQQDANIPKSHRNLSLAQLIARTDHHNQKMRKNAFLGIQQLISDHPQIVEGPSGAPAAILLYSRITTALMDSECEVRKSIRAVLRVLLSNPKVTLPLKVGFIVKQLHPLISHPTLAIKQDGILALHSVLQYFHERVRGKVRFEHMMDTLQLISKFIDDYSDSCFQSSKIGIMTKAFESFAMSLQLIQNITLERAFDQARTGDHNLASNPIEVMEEWMSNPNSGYVFEIADSIQGQLLFSVKAFCKILVVADAALFSTEEADPASSMSLGGVQQEAVVEIVSKLLLNFGLVVLFVSNASMNTRLFHFNSELIQFIEKVVAADSFKQLHFDCATLGLVLSVLNNTSESVAYSALIGIKSVKKSLEQLYRSRRAEQSVKFLSSLQLFQNYALCLQSAACADLVETKNVLYRYSMLKDLPESYRRVLFRILARDFVLNWTSHPDELRSEWLLSSLDLFFQLDRTSNSSLDALDICNLLSNVLRTHTLDNAELRKSCESFLSEKVWSFPASQRPMFEFFDEQSQDMLIQLLSEFQNCDKELLRSTTKIVLHGKVDPSVRRNLLWSFLYMITKPVREDKDHQSRERLPQVYSMFVSILLSVGHSECSGCLPVLTSFTGSLPRGFLNALPRVLCPKLRQLCGTNESRSTKQLNLLKVVCTLDCIFDDEDWRSLMNDLSVDPMSFSY